MIILINSTPLSYKFLLNLQFELCGSTFIISLLLFLEFENIKVIPNRNHFVKIGAITILPELPESRVACLPLTLSCYLITFSMPKENICLAIPPF